MVFPTESPEAAPPSEMDSGWAPRTPRLSAAEASGATTAAASRRSAATASARAMTIVYAMNTPSALIGGSLYWLLGGITPGILELDLDRRRLALIPMPANISSLDYLRHWVMPGEGGDLGFLCLSGCSVAELWKRKRDRGDAAQWVLRRTIDLAKLLSLSSSEDGFPPVILGFAEEDRVSFLATNRGICMVQLESMQFKRSFDISKLDVYHPFASVYTAGLGTGGGQDGPEPVHNT